MTTSSSALAPYHLQCEQRSEPLGLGEPHPRLRWRLRSDRRGDAPAAYRLRVWRCRPDGEADRPVWEPDWTGSEDSTGASYDGQPLESSTRYGWSVQVRDTDGGESAPVTSWFETGLLHADEWSASWIGRAPRTAPKMEPPQDVPISAALADIDPAAHLRRDYYSEQTPVRARAYVTARGLYELRINGERVGDAELAPGWVDYRYRQPYQSYDVTHLVAEGANTVAAVLADGWWSGYVGMERRRQGRHYGPAPRLLVQLVIDYADGSRRAVVSDGDWTESPGDVVAADLLMGEYRDARLEPRGWDRPGFDDTDWVPAGVFGRDHGLLVAERDEPVRVTEELPAVSIQRLGPDRWIADFGQNAVGRVRLRLREPEGTRVVLRHAEVLDEKGELYTANLRTAEAVDTYVCAGEAGGEVFEPSFTVHGFRYAEISGPSRAPEAFEVTARVLHNQLDWTGEFACSDATVDRLMRNIRWGQRGNFVAVPTDCPQRDERLGWTADAQIFAPTACLNADAGAFFARWMDDVVDAQTAEGAFTDVAPLLLLEREGAPAWGDAGVILPWHLYRAYGDARLLERCYPAMTRWVEHIRRDNPDLIWRNSTGNHYGDWLQVGVHTARDVLATAYFANSAHLVSRAAAATGRDDDARRYADLAARITAAFRAAFVTADGRIEGETQTAYLLALAFDLLTPEQGEAAAGHLVADIEARGRSLTTGFVGVALLCPVLVEIGRADLAYALLHDDRYPSWGYSIAHGATTIWERWDGWTDEGGFQSAEMNSFNHYSLGSIGAWLYRHVAGIDQTADSVGYAELLLAPRPGGRLTWARASYESVRGRVESHWRIDGDTLTLDVLVPPGARATVRVPTHAPDQVAESGVPVEEQAGIAVLGEGPDHLLLGAGSGAYTFTAPAPAPAAA
ncbi:alpha-L-rhamnosidase [Streptomonospora arabica]|uniref:alpha-L-rhamnosidase n=1 Tax=Streptomonospora arabica TaxID=412417 RepID=A0ABV9SP57_9ACTN